MQLFQLIRQPLYQGLLFIVLSSIISLIVKPRIADNLWVICGVIYCFFILTNTVLAFYAPDIWQYIFISLGISVLYLCLTAVTANMLIHLLRLEGSGESAMMFIVIIFHPVTLLLSVFLKWAFLKIY